MIKVSELIAQVEVKALVGGVDGFINRIVTDSRDAHQGDAFVAIKGTASDGHTFIEQVIEQGVHLIFCETIPDVVHRQVTYVKVLDTRAIVLPLALSVLGHPEKQLKLIGVTGTNGKTTVTTLIWEALSHLGYTPALMGTVSKYFGKEKQVSKLTTPGPIELAQDLRHAVDAGCTHFIMEVSSHALHQKRVQSLAFDVAVFTNLSHDHLDYHGSMDEYAKAKKLLFDGLSESAIAIVNQDDPYAGFMTQDCVADVWNLSFNDGSSTLHSLTTSGCLIEVDGDLLESSLIGQFNAYNVSQAYLACRALGCNRAALIESFRHVTGAKGRMQRILVESEIELPKVIVDYAHTPDALANILSTLGELRAKDERIITIFGCGGNRDAKKRPIMAQVAERYSDEIIATSDNPRHEDPELILDEIFAGAKELRKWKRITERPQAIKETIARVETPCVLVIAGKGHEDYQEIKGVRYPMDDSIIALQSLAERLGAYRKMEVR